jgi:ABC-type sugar transport system ATPase subunit
MAEATPVVEMRNIKKHFGAVQALRGVDLALHHNEVLGLVGDNAAGKSTLMKVLSGAYIPDDGEIYIEGKKVHLGSPMDARRQGIEMVYQDYALANNLDVAANVFLGREVVQLRLGPIGIMDDRYMEQETKSLLDRLKIDIPFVRQKVERLSGGQRQAVAIARAIYWQAKLLILDEPTNNLGVVEQAKVISMIKRLCEQGVAIILISHTMPDVFAISHRIIVLRRGAKVGEKVTADTTSEEIVQYIMGLRNDYATAQ